MSRDLELEYSDELYKILDKFAPDWEEDPLDGDGVDILCLILNAELNKINGNYTEEEYNDVISHIM